MAYPDSKVHGANMGPTRDLSAPDEPHVGPMNLAIKVADGARSSAGTVCTTMFGMFLWPLMIARMIFSNP